MSTGHFHTQFKNVDHVKLALAKAVRMPAIKVRLHDTKFKLNRDYDIPYLGGYSRDGKIIYIDRHLPMTLPIGGKRIHIFPYLITHERTEKALLDFAGMRYDEAHRCATFVAHLELNKHDISSTLYEKALDPYIKADQHEKIRKVPIDLDYRPYKDSHDTILISRMREALND